MVFNRKHPTVQRVSLLSLLSSPVLVVLSAPGGANGNRVRGVPTGASRNRGRVVAQNDRRARARAGEPGGGDTHVMHTRNPMTGGRVY